MRRFHRWMVVIALGACSLLVGCKQAAEENAKETRPAEVEHLEGVDVARVKLTADAVKRLEIKTDTVRNLEYTGKRYTAIPYGAILYDTEGNTWTYTSPQPLTYVRHPVTIDHIVGDLAFLSNGPPPGTPVVTVGAAELYGSEIEFEED